MLGMHINMRLKAVLGEDSRFLFEVVIFGGAMPEGIASGGGDSSFPMSTPTR